MTCELTDRERRLDDFVLGKLSEQETEAVEIHVFGCAECLHELRLREQMIAQLQAARVLAQPTLRAQSSPGFVRALSDFFRARPSAWIYAGAAAALLVLILTLPLFRSEDPAQNYAANFTPLPELESLIGQPQRSANLKVEALSPRPDANYAGEILFRWRITKDGAEVDAPLTLKILNNHAELIRSTEVVGNAYRMNEPLVPGLYYWTLEHEGEAKHIGKFFFKRSH